MALPESSIRIVAVIFAIRFIAAEARFERSSRRGEATVFPLVVGMRLVFGGMIPFLLYGASELVKSGERMDLFLALLCIGGAIGTFLMWPGTIFVDQNLIQERRWFGLRRTDIPWTEVIFAGGDIDGSVVIRSTHDRIIRHTQYHVDRAGLIELLKQHCEKCSWNYPAPKPWVPLSGA